MAKTKVDWAMRRHRQWNRFGGKISKAYDKPSTTSIAKAAWSGVKYLRTLVNAERFKLDTTITTAISSTGFVTQLNAIAQGDAIANRTGNSVLMSYLHINSIMAMSSSASASFCRVIVFLDKQQIGDTAPAGSDVIAGSGGPANHYNASTIGRFQILYDQLFDMNLQGKNTRVIRKLIKLNKHARFNGTASSDIQKNGLYIMFHSNEATNTIAHTTECRLGWYDN